MSIPNSVFKDIINMLKQMSCDLDQNLTIDMIKRYMWSKPYDNESPLEYIRWLDTHIEKIIDDYPAKFFINKLDLNEIRKIKQCFFYDTQKLGT